MEQVAPSTRAPRGLRASEAVSDALRKFVAEHPERDAVELLSVSRPTFARLFGGLPVQHATLILAASRLGVDLAGTIGDEVTAP
jgi:hypothetical protein